MAGVRTGRPVTIPDREVVRISFSGDQIEALRKIAATTGASVAHLVRKATEQYLSTLDQG